MKGYNEITCMDTNYNKELEKMKKKKNPNLSVILFQLVLLVNFWESNRKKFIPLKM